MTYQTANKRMNKGKRQPKLVTLKSTYINYLDKKALYIAEKLAQNTSELLIKKRPATKLILNYIKELYEAAKCERTFEHNNFEIAYHNPISSELEFLVARILFHYANKKKLGWKIYLRRQVGKTAPDIRIEQHNTTIGIIEVKAKAGWIQPVFSKERYDHDLAKFEEGLGNYNPKSTIEQFSKQIEKYFTTYKIKKDQVFIFLPSFIHVHRKKSANNSNDYISFFSENIGLPKNSLILLSNNPILNLSDQPTKEKHEPTDKFEKMILRLTELSSRN